MIDITGVNLGEFARKVYDLSVPVGMGIVQFIDGPLSPDDTEAILVSCEGNEFVVLCMDCVNGRCCKMYVYRHVKNGEDRLTIEDNWPDHTDEDFETLLTYFGKEKKHEHKKISRETTT